eukprot:4482751-Prymnesium_polylepis.1
MYRLFAGRELGHRCAHAAAIMRACEPNAPQQETSPTKRGRAALCDAFLRMQPISALCLAPSSPVCRYAHRHHRDEYTTRY